MNRLNIYKEKTKPLLDHYERKGLLMVVNGEQKTEDVFDEIIRNLGEK